ncbi:hypothetical protein NDU88_005188 [Pleurodeles waltl]|uniref:Uncharacterized protein n=1 Tax=Pleurodeles waltl TaxID=8319 RepID=A0AAV7SL49_PLEWA|nr:hypothetical protein NDU88_005188 [Pleurodeles waltl]
MSQSPPGPLLQLSIGPPGRTSPPQGKALLGRRHTLGAPLTGRQARLPTQKSPRPSAPPRPPGPLLKVSLGPPGRTSPPQGKALLGRLHTLGAPLAGCRARAPNTEEPRVLCASTSARAPTPALCRASWPDLTSPGQGSFGAPSHPRRSSSWLSGPGSQHGKARGPLRLCVSGTDPAPSGPLSRPPEPLPRGRQAPK